MHCRAIPIVGPGLHAVAQIHDDRARRGRHVDPAVVERLGLQTTSVVLQQQRHHTRIGVVAERRLAQIGESVALSLGDRIAHGIVIEANGTSVTATGHLPTRLVPQTERIVNESHRPIGEHRQLVEQLGHRLTEAGQRLRPTIALIDRGVRGVDEVEHLLVIALALGELAIEVAHGVLLIAHDRRLDRSVGGEETARLVPRTLDQVVEAVSRQEEEPVITTGRVECGERRGRGARDVDGGDQLHEGILSRQPWTATWLEFAQRSGGTDAENSLAIHHLHSGRAAGNGLLGIG